jgi:HK97 family phage major capsid protein
MAMVTIEELQTRLTELRNRITELDNEYAGQAFPSDAEQEWARANQEVEETETLIRQLTVRRERIEALSERPENREPGATFNTPNPGVARGEDIYDLTTVRGDANDPAIMGRELRDRAMRHLEIMRLPLDRYDDSDPKGHVERLVGRLDGNAGRFSRHLLTVGSPAYERAFGKTLAGEPLTAEETRARDTAMRAALGIENTGNYPVPVSLDPTVIPASDGAVNPYRQISRVVQITGNTWSGVTSTGITAAYHEEWTEATENAPVLVQPSVMVEKAHAFVPYGIEVGEDWAGMQADLARMFADAKDELEAVKFTTGAGVGSDEPQGIIVGATTTTTSAAKDAFSVADVYQLEADLPPRHQARASFVAHKGTYTRVRQFDTYGGASLWVQLAQGTPTVQGAGTPTLIGYPAYQCSGVDTLIATGKKYMVLGDFSRFLIVDRVGMSIELIPHLFGAVAHYPIGQRGLYAYWRNSSLVLDANAFRVLVGHA